MTRNVLLVSFLWGFQCALYAQELAVDHLWIRVSPGAPEASSLVEAGFQFQEFDQATTVASVTATDSRVGQHKGQGTASMVVRFHNVYLELIWVQNPDLLKQVAPKHGKTLLDSRESPIGIGLRHVGEDASSLPFESSSHWAPWMRPLIALPTASHDPSARGHPAIFVVPRYMRWDLRTQSNPRLLESAKHRPNLNEVTLIRIHGPAQSLRSEAVQYLLDARLIEFVQSESHLLELEFDNRQEDKMDFRPTLPLVIYH